MPASVTSECASKLCNPITEGGIIKPQFSLIASFSGADCFWMPFACSCRLRVIRPRYGVLDKFLMSATLQRKPSVMGIAVRFVTFFSAFSLT